MTIPIILLSLLFSSFTFQKFVIIGTVRDTTGRSVPNVRVLAIDENFQPIRTIFVDGSGQFFIRGLSPGRYQFRVETMGTPYQEHETGWIELQSIRARGGGTENYPLDIVLKLKPNKNAAPRTDTVFAQNVPDAARLAYERGAKNFKDGLVEEGMASLKQALALFPDYFDALESFGRELVKAGQYEQSVAPLKRAIKVNPRAAGSFYALGVAFLQLNQLEPAIMNLTQSASFDASNANSFMMLGLAFGANQQMAEAEEAFKKALQVGGSALADAHFYLAAMFEKQKRYADAANELELFLKDAKEIKDPEKLKAMIRTMKEKEKNMTGKPLRFTAQH